MGTGVLDGGLVKSVVQSGVAEPLSASNAYTLSFIVATKSTSWTAPLIVRPDAYSGCAYTVPSTGYA